MKKYPDFDESLGRFQFEHLENYFIWLSDEDAKRKMANTEKMTANSQPVDDPKQLSLLPNVCQSF